MRTTMVVLLLSALVGSAMLQTSKAGTTDKEYEGYLISRLSDANRGVRTSAAQLLGDLQRRAAVPRLMWMVEHDLDYAARITAAVALCKIGDPKVLPLLRRRARHDVNKTVRRVLAGIVETMESATLASHP